MNVTKAQLGALFSMANAIYKELDKNDLDDQQFIAMCWAKAVNEFLLFNPTLVFPAKRLLEPPTED